MADSISGSAFREALAHFASGVTIVTAVNAEERVGFTATAFSALSLAPPLVLVCISKTASAYGGVVGAARFGVNVLDERQRWLAEQFATTGIDRFHGVPLVPGGDAAVPLIEGSLVSLYCRRHALHDAGDHSILIGEVIAATLGAGRPLVHHARRFGAFVLSNDDAQA